MVSVDQLSKVERVIAWQVRKTVGNQLGSGDVEDIVQDVKIALLTNESRQHQPKKGLKLPSFVHMVSRQIAIDALRKAGRRPRCVQIDEARSVEQTEVDALTLLLKHEKGQRVRAAVAQLSPRDQELVPLFFSKEGLEELAAKRGTTANALHIRKCRIIKNLQAILKR